MDAVEVDEEADEPRRVVLVREPGQSFGMSIAGGIGSLAGDVPIFVAGMQPEGLAASTKKIQASHILFCYCTLCYWLSNDYKSPGKLAFPLFSFCLAFGHWSAEELHASICQAV